MSQATTRIGPADHGQRMSLADFDHVEVEEGHLYELGRGVIIVSDVPKKKHLAQVVGTRDQLSTYKLKHSGRLYGVLSGSECKLLVTGFESERHPDLAVYKSFPPEESEDFWSVWIPELVIEIVSLGSEIRDYVEKREEYLAFGVQEYWIIDEAKQEMLVLRRVGGRWRERVIRPPEKYRPPVLPGFEFDLQRVFEAARAVEA